MFTIKAEVRKEQGKGASRRLRAANKFPAIVYGGKEAPVAIELDHDKLWNLQAKAEFYSEVLTIVVGGKEEKVKVQAVQRHAFKPKLHSHRLRSRVIANLSKKTPLLRGFFMAQIRLIYCPPGAALQLIAQIRRRAFDGQRIGGRIPENTFAQQHGIKVDG